MVNEVSNIQELLVKLLIGHKLLQRYKIPIIETALHVFINLTRINVLDKSKVLPRNAILNTGWCDQALETLSIAHHEVSIYLLSEFNLLTLTDILQRWTLTHTNLHQRYLILVWVII